MKDICIKYRVTEEEYLALNKQFGRLCWKAAHELKRKNSRNNYTDDAEDIYQNLVEAMLRAGSYYKRQIYIEKCLSLVQEATGVVVEYDDDGVLQVVSSGDNLMGWVVSELSLLWSNRTRHGANRQKFGKFQEQLLDRIVRKVVPRNLRPRRNDSLKIDSKFGTYCKAIVWNSQKSMGKRITREKSIRSGQVSLSEYDYLVAN